MDRNAIEQLAAVVVDAAMEVHRRLGPGLLAIVYEAALAEAVLNQMRKDRKQA